MLLLYNLLSSVSLLVYLPWLLLKKGPPDRARFLRERLGLSGYSKADIWVHAVSVGETIACMPFLKTLKREFPDKKIVFSTTTYTGQQVAIEKFPEADRIMYMPWDTGLCINRVVNSMNPDVFITVETELWPILFQKLKNTGSHIILLNGRLSPSSFKGYRSLRFFMKEVLSYPDFLFMQTAADAERILAIGATDKKTGIMGNFKFDIDFDEKKPPQWIDGINGHILLAGSTHRGEDEIILDAYEMIKERVQNLPTGQAGPEHRTQTNNLRLILAPRHPERFKEVEELLIKRGLDHVRRSELSVHGSRFTVHEKQPDIILLDTIGELSRVFSKAAITFIGGSLLPYGGHNILEPAYWSNPIIFGPHMENFPIAGEFLEKSAALEVKDSEEIAKAVTGLLQNPEKAKLMGQNAKAIVASNRGAVKKALDLVRGYIGTA